MSGKIPPDAFQYYLGLGADRSYRRVAEHYGVSKRAVTKVATAGRWQARVAELEQKAQEGAEKKALESLEAMNLRHLKSLKVIQGRALEALRSMPLATAMEAVRALDLAIRQERVIRGEPGDRSAVSVEEVVKQEYRRWMRTGEDNGEQDDGGEV